MKKENPKQITLRLPDELHEALRVVSDELSISLSDLITISLWRYFDRF